MGRLGAPRCRKVQKVRFGAFGPKLSSATISKYTLWGHLSKSEEVLIFSKNKKMQKVTSAFLHTCTAFRLIWEVKSQKCKKLHFLHFGAPKSSKSHFCIRVRRFCSIWEARNHFLRFWSKKIVRSPHWAPGCPIH